MKYNEINFYSHVQKFIFVQLFIKFIYIYINIIGNRKF